MDKRAVIYIRVSDPSQIENNSLGVQEKACRAYAKQKGYEVAEPIFRDEGISAKHVNTRPGMRQLLEYCCEKKNNISYVIVYKLDRWSRNTEEGLMASAILANYGIEMASTTEGIEKSPTGSLLTTILLALGQFDNEMKGERIRDNMLALYRKGVWCWKCPIGYVRPFKTNEENKGKAPMPHEKLRPILYTLFQEAGTSLYTKQQLADRMNVRGFEDIVRFPATIKTVIRITKNSFYFGKMYCKKWKEYSTGKHEAIVDEALWTKAHNAVFNKKIKYKTQSSSEYLLKGTIKCNECGRHMTSSNPRGRSNTYTNYECGNKACRRTRIDTGEAHAQFLEILKIVKPTKRTMKLFDYMVFNEWDKIINTAKKEAKMINERIEVLEADLISIRKSHDKGIYTEDMARREAEKVNNEIVVLGVERSDIKFEQYDKEKVRNFTEYFLLHLDRLWDKLIEPAMKQALQNKVFPMGVVCTRKKEVRTAGLSPSFELIATLNSSDLTIGEGTGQPSLKLRLPRIPR